METLRLGSTGEQVERWQNFLLGVGLYAGEVNGIFDEITRVATQQFQRRHGLVDDGIAGNRSIGEAMRVGFPVVDDDSDAPDCLDRPQKPNFAPLGPAGREALFGKYSFEPVGGADPEAIRITSDWQKENIVVTTIPQLVGVFGASATGRVSLHRLVAPRVVELFARWEQAGLRDLVLSYAGSYVPRFIRGSRSVLSAHAHGSAFDINAAWNPLGAIPALLDKKGSVRRLVPIANELGFYWGGHFTRRDGMHFELTKV